MLVHVRKPFACKLGNIPNNQRNLSGDGLLDASSSKGRSNEISEICDQVEGLGSGVRTGRK